MISLGSPEFLDVIDVASSSCPRSSGRVVRYILGQADLNLIMGCLNMKNLCLYCVCVSLGTCMPLWCKIYFDHYISFSIHSHPQIIRCKPEVFWSPQKTYLIIFLRYPVIFRAVLLVSPPFILTSISDLRVQVIHCIDSEEKAKRGEVINGRKYGSRRSFSWCGNNFQLIRWKGNKSSSAYGCAVWTADLAKASDIPFALWLSLFRNVS